MCQPHAIIRVDLRLDLAPLRDGQQRCGFSQKLFDLAGKHLLLGLGKGSQALNGGFNAGHGATCTPNALTTVPTRLRMAPLNRS